MKNTRMIIWVMLLTLAAALLAGCDGSQNPTMPQQLPETAPTTVTQPLPAPTENQSQQYELLPPPVQTEAPTQPTEPAAVLLELSAEERCGLNLFLSNFSEQWFHEGFVWYEAPSEGAFLAEQADIQQIIGFAWLHAKINLDDDLQEVHIGEQYYYGFSFEILNAIAEDFFGRTLAATDLPTTQSEQFFLYNGLVCGPAADGEAYTNMVVSELVYDLGNETIRVEFAIYDTWALAETGIADFEQEVCCLTGQQAQARQELALHLNGAAIIRPHTLEDGQETYQLVSYELFTPAE